MLSLQNWVERVIFPNAICASSSGTLGAAPEKAPLEPRPALEIEAGSGIAGDHSFGRLRHVTIVFEDDWNAAAAAIGRAVDPIGRRANVLVSGGNGSRFVGTTVRLGPAVIEIKGITRRVQ